MGLTLRALIVLIRLTELATRIRQGVHAIDEVPRVFVAGIILDCLLHGLGQESSNIDEAIKVTLSTVIAHVEVLVCNAIVVHHTEPIQQILIAVDRRWYPHTLRCLVQKNVIVNSMFISFEYSFDGCGSQACRRTINW